MKISLERRMRDAGSEELEKLLGGDSEARIKQFPKALIEELLQVEINRHLGATLRVLRRQKGLAQRLL